MPDLRVGVLGAGMIANEHVGAYAATPGVRVVAVVDPVAPKAERLAGRVDAAVVPDLEAVLTAGVDIVSVCTPPLTHADPAVAALEAGCHVLCEKPLARTLDDGQRIAEAARTAPGLLMVGHVSRFEPDHAAAKAAVEAGRIGAVRMVSHSMTTSLPGWSEGGWFTDPEQSGGPLLDLGVHGFDFLSWVVGSEPVRVHAVGADTPTGPVTYALATVRYANGAMGLVESSWAHPASHGFALRTEIVGTRGRIDWDYAGLTSGTLHRDGQPPTRWEPLGARGYLAEIGAFVEAIRTGAPAPIPVDDGLRSLRTALAALESVRTGDAVDLSDRVAA